MSASDTARTAYESSRDEILERIRLRDNALLAFLGATGLVFGVASGTPPRPQFLLILPYLSLAAAFIVTQHDRTIGCICAFISQELEPFFAEHSEHAPIWETCIFLHRYSATAMNLRFVSHGVLILTPAIVALVWGFSSAAGGLLRLVWWCATVVTILCLFFLIATHIERRKYYRQTTWRPVDDGPRDDGPRDD